MPWNISYSLSMRGRNDDEPWLVFIGSQWDFLEEIFSWLTAGGYAASSFEMKSEHAVIMRNGYSYYRIAVHLTGMNPVFASLDDLRLLIESRIRAAGHHIRYYDSYDDFLNI